MISLVSLTGISCSNLNTGTRASAPITTTTSNTSVGKESVSTTPSKPSLPSDDHICIDNVNLGKKWPLQDAITNWNHNNKYVFITKCAVGLAQITIWKTDNTYFSDDRYFGEATFHANRDKIIISIWEGIPVDLRLSILCHELGHALGRPHVENSFSCMGADSTYGYPSKEDLQAIANMRNWTVARVEKLAEAVAQ